jgi:hypothetical protein
MRGEKLENRGLACGYFLFPAGVRAIVGGSPIVGDITARRPIFH